MAQLIMQEEATTPSTPSGGNWKVYPKASGLYLLDDLGVELGPMVPRDGWIPVYDSWTYASAATINVPTDATLLYQKGWGIRFKQGGAYKYMYITTVAATLLTVTGGSDYSVANAAITDIAVCPFPSAAFGFPSTHAYSPTAGGSALTVGNGTTAGRFVIRGGLVKWFAGFTLGSTSSMGTGTVTLTNPLTLSTSGLSDQYIGVSQVLDAGTARIPCLIEINTTVATIFTMIVSGSNVVRGSFSATVPMTWATGDKIYVEAEGMIP